jgi:hypothetical protein
MTCPNCSYESVGRFCPNCSQRMLVKRISFKEGWTDFWGRIYGFDSMLPRTLRDLTIRPGIVAKRVIEGNRVRYYGPVGYFFLMIALTFLLASMLDVDMHELLVTRGNELTGIPKPTGGAAEAQKRLVAMVVDNLKWFNFLVVIFQALWLRVFFRNSGYNLLEHSILVFFVMGHMYWITMLDVIITAISGVHIPSWATALISFVFFGYAAMNLYSNVYRIEKAEAFVKGLLTYIVSFIVFSIFIVIMTVVMVLTDPEMLELMRPGNNK